MVETIARVRRDMPRNAHVMAICDDWEKQREEIRRLQPKPRVDRKTYMREFMRAKRKRDRERRQAEKRGA
ncbi:MAG TPA: hypothetical protein VLJ17_15240 [Xanthobacteraceae bacterium]|nr:hypothetical protein [Xanthobacteraceae bacterium]